MNGVVARLARSGPTMCENDGMRRLLALVIIGCGPAGEKAGAQAAYFGKRVAIIERAPEVGGSCINTGTVPSKTLRESALYFSGLRQRWNIDERDDQQG